MADVTVRVLLVDDDPLVRAGLRLLLGGDDGVAVVGEAADGDEVAAAVAAHDPDAARAALHRHLSRVAREFQRGVDTEQRGADPAAAAARPPVRVSRGERPTAGRMPRKSPANPRRS